jgi:hypothetical protein
MLTFGVSGTPNFGIFNSSGTGNSTTNWSSGGRNARLGMGAGYSQFLLTEAPTIASSTQNSVTSTRSAGAPASCGIGFTTRLLMGYMGYIGYLNSLHTASVNAEFLGSDVNNNSYINGTPNNVFKLPLTTVGPGPSSLTTSDVVSSRASRLFQGRGENTYSLLDSIQEFSPATLPTNLKYTVFEPTLSCGNTNGVQSVSQPLTYTYTGPQYKFSMLGRIFDMKIFGPFTDSKYTLLDSITIPCNAAGFYQEGGANKEFWLIPSGENMAFLMPK